MKLGGDNHRLVGDITHAAGPFVFCCEHAGKAMIEVTPTASDRALLDDHWGSDIGAGTVTESLARQMDSVGILGLISRLWIDLNRVESSDTLIVEACGGIPVSFNQALGAEERRDRITRHHTSYHQALDDLITQRVTLGPTRLVSIHSFTPVWEGVPREMEIGVLFAEDTPAVRAITDALRGEGFVTALNAPYSGLSGNLIYSAMLHGGRAQIPYLEFEIRQDLIRTAESAEEVATRIARALSVLQP